ncbi:MAG: nucleotidyltransferase domain-containing protein [candidate division KSB1 bacterium]|nr:nucleotidyltransferase domain-containing protein [candidate division KSB1 bacterium]
MIIHKYRPAKIYQWGSLLNERLFSEHSDIDIALEGLDSVEDYFALLGDAGEMTSFPLDIVLLEKIHPLHAESIKKKGRLIYERE